MIFFLIIILAWGILNVGMLGIEWGYSRWVQARLDTSVQFLVLDSYSDTHQHRSDERTLQMGVGVNALTKLTTTFPNPGVTQMKLSTQIEWPLRLGTSSLETSSSVTVSSAVSAQLLPARQVGLPQTGPVPLLGALPYALDKDAWESISEGPLNAQLNTMGEILSEGKMIGQFGQPRTYIGQAVPEPEAPGTAYFPLEGYVPIVTRVGMSKRVVGFGHVTITGSRLHLMIRKYVSTTGSQNASAHLPIPWLHISQQDLTQVFFMNRTLKGAILAPTFYKEA